MSAAIPEGYVLCKHCAGHGVLKRPVRQSARFQEFWLCWPRNERKQDKAACQKKWADRGYDAIADQIITYVAVKAKTQGWRAGYIEAPLVYLNNRRWEDEIVPDDKPAVDSLWTKSDAGILAMAKQRGVTARPGEDWPELIQRIQRAA